MYIVHCTAYSTNAREDVPMPAEHSSAGDPARTLELLWREPGPAGSRRGPRQGLSAGRVAAAAIALADSDGLGSVTMRAVAQVLGVVPMSLYTYVPGKAELLDLMLDTVYRQMPRGDLSGLPWRERLAAVAQENRDLFTLHPWIAGISTSRPPPTPSACRASSTAAAPSSTPAGRRPPSAPSADPGWRGIRFWCPRRLGRRFSWQRLRRRGTGRTPSTMAASLQRP